MGEKKVLMLEREGEGDREREEEIISFDLSLLSPHCINRALLFDHHS
jgi:hypothetical protein